MTLSGRAAVLVLDHPSRHFIAEVSAIDSNFQNNARGAQSGSLRKSSQRASLRLENCHMGGNQVFGAGACTQSELVLANCVFEGTDETNIYHERGAVVRTELGVAGEQAQAQPSATPTPSEQSGNDTQQSSSRRKKSRRSSPDAAAQLIRKLIGRP